MHLLSAFVVVIILRYVFNVATTMADRSLSLSLSRGTEVVLRCSVSAAVQTLVEVPSSSSDHCDDPFEYSVMFLSVIALHCQLRLFCRVCLCTREGYEAHLPADAAKWLTMLISLIEKLVRGNMRLQKREKNIANGNIICRYETISVFALQSSSSFPHWNLTVCEHSSENHSAAELCCYQIVI